MPENPWECLKIRELPPRDSHKNALDLNSRLVEVFPIHPAKMLTKNSEASSLPHWQMVLLVSKTVSWDVSADLTHEIHGRLLNML